MHLSFECCRSLDDHYAADCALQVYSQLLIEHISVHCFRVLHRGAVYKLGVRADTEQFQRPGKFEIYFNGSVLENASVVSKIE